MYKDAFSLTFYALEADLADKAQEEDDGAEESVSAAAVEKECDAVACELGIRYPTLQSIYAGKLNKQSIQVSFGHSVALSGSVSSTVEGSRHDATRSTGQGVRS